MRKKVIAGNWKMNKTNTEAVEMLTELKELVKGIDNVGIIIGAPFTALSDAVKAVKGSNIAIAAENVYPKDSGAYTGEVSPVMLKSIGVEYVILGHSERREYFKESDEFINEKVSIVSNHCWGGFTYHSLKAEFLSPFINMFIPQEDYIRLLEDFDDYMKEEIKYYKNEYEPNLQSEYPVALLGDVELHFNHYKSFEEAKEKWDQRKQRINRNNLFVEMQTENEELAKRFNKLPYNKKIVFVPFETQLESAVSLKKMNENYTGAFYASVNYLAMGRQTFYNVLNLLNGERDFYRFD